MAEETESKRESQDQVLVVALAAGKTHEVAGELAGVSAKTVQRRLLDADFTARVTRGRAARHAQISGALLTSAEQAVTTLVDLLDDADPKVRLAASRELLTSSHRYVDQADVLERLRSLEQAVKS